MVKTVFSIVVITLLFLITSFKPIDDCYLSFQHSILIKQNPDRLPDPTPRTLSVNSDEVKISRVDGYRIRYNNAKNAPFADVKVELSQNGEYENDQENLIRNLHYLYTHSSASRKEEFIDTKVNGYRILGISNTTIDVGSNLGTFIMFPGEGVTVYFYFNNLKPEYRNFVDADDYKKQRNQFFEEYTKHLRVCK